jgi:hypothetical protein
LIILPIATLMLLSKGTSRAVSAASPSPTPQGSLWAPNVIPASQTGFIAEFSGLALTGIGTPTPAITIQPNPPTKLSRPRQAIFDSAGNLWVSECPSFFDPKAADSIIEYKFTTLASLPTASGPVAPDLIIEDDGTSKSINCPLGMVFDAAQQNLWVGNESQTADHSCCGGLAKFPVAELTGSGIIKPTPTLIISNDPSTASLNSISGLEFDSQGNLWVANSLVCNTPYLSLLGACSMSLVKFSAQQLASGTATAPVRILISRAWGTRGRSDGTNTALFGFAFDASNNLWIPGCDTNIPTPDQFDLLFNFKATTMRTRRPTRHQPPAAPCIWFRRT